MQVILLSLFGVVKVNDLVASLFADAKGELSTLSSSNVAIFDLASDDHSKAVDTLESLLDTLRPLSLHWAALRLARGGWTCDVRRKAVTIILRLISQIWFRMVRYYRFWPWPLARVFDDRLPRADRAAVVQRVFDCKPCCLDDGVVGPVAADLESVEELLAETPKRKFLKAFFESAKAQTIPIEERFKRVRTSSQSNAGHSQHVAIVTSNFALRELRSVHEAACCKKGITPEKKLRKSAGSRLKVKKQNKQSPRLRRVTPYNLHWTDVLEKDTGEYTYLTR